MSGHLRVAFLCGLALSAPCWAQRNQVDSTHIPRRYAAATSDAATDIAEWWKHFDDMELNSLVERALRANVDLGIADARVRVAVASRQVTTAGFWPEVDANAAVTRNSNLYYSVQQSSSGPLVSPVAGTTGSLGGSASWDLDISGATRAKRRAASWDLATQRDAQRAESVSVISDVAQSYMELRGFQKQIQVAEANLKAQQDTFGLTEARYKAGLVGEVDVSRARAQLETTRSQVPVVEGGIQSAIHRLGVLLGESPETLEAELHTVQAIPVAPLEITTGLPSELLLRRADIRESLDEVQAAVARVRIARADVFPRLTLTGNFSTDSGLGGSSLPYARLFGFGPSLTLPIFSGGQIVANIRAKKEREKEAVLQYKKTVLHALQQVEDAIIACQKERIRRDALVGAVDSNRVSVELSMALYSRGLQDFLSVLDAERNLYAVEDRLAESERDLAVDTVRLYVALGGDWESTERVTTAIR